MRGRSVWLLVATVIATVASPAPAQRTLDLTGKPIATLPQPFSRINGLRELANGLVLVTDPVELAIVVGDFAHQSSRHIGRTGEGPNEYRFPGGVFSGPGDVTWVPDPPLHRLHKVSAEGMMGDQPMPAGFPGFPSIRGNDRSGRLYIQGSNIDPDKGTFADSVSISRWDVPSGKVEPIGKISIGSRLILKRPSGPMSLDRTVTPFPSLDAWVALPDGRLAIVHQSPYRIDLIEGPGRVSIGLPIAFTPLPVTARERAEYRERNSSPPVSHAMLKNGGSGAPGMRFDFLDEDFPVTLPAFIASAVLATPEGEIWIGRSMPAGVATATYDIHDGKGILIGRATLKANSTVVGFGRGVVYVSRKNPDDDLLYLEKFAR